VITLTCLALRTAVAVAVLVLTASVLSVVTSGPSMTAAVMPGIAASRALAAATKSTAFATATPAALG